MENDYSALASRIAATSDVLGCMILSSDGVVLGTFPIGEQGGIKPAWLQFAALGAATRGFVRFSDDQLWAYVRSGPYAAFAVASAQTLPGVLLDNLEQALLLATDSRDHRLVAQKPTRVDLVTSEPLQPLAVAAPAAPVAFTAAAIARPPAPVAPAAAAWNVDQSRRPVEANPEPVMAREGAADDEKNPALDGDEVDRVALAREFSSLLQDDWRSVEDSSDNP
ncbi:MAG: hypothetical protein ABR600_10560 [Actinomycetota bacterium]